MSGEHLDDVAAHDVAVALAFRLNEQHAVECYDARTLSTLMQLFACHDNLQ